MERSKAQNVPSSWQQRVVKVFCVPVLSVQVFQGERLVLTLVLGTLPHTMVLTRASDSNYCDGNGDDGTPC